MKSLIKTIDTQEIDAVSGAGTAGFLAGYFAARAAGFSHDTSMAAGALASEAEDALNGQ
jgi:hypothetical protein